jgi:hypothetical protein
MNGELLLIITGAVLFLLILAYVVQRVARAGKLALADPQLQDWLDREQALKARGEWRLDPEARLVLPAVDLQAEIGRYQPLQADLALIPLNRRLAPPELASFQPYLGQELVWRLRYQDLKQGRRSDLQPVRGGPTLAILELPETFPGGAVAQIGQQLYLIYRPGSFTGPAGNSSSVPPVPVMMRESQVIWADGRRFYWRLAETLYEARSFRDEDGRQIITLYEARLRVDPAAPPDVALILALLDYYLYSSPVQL